VSGAVRYLIVNADDFGRSPGVNRGVARTYEHGIVTSASLMVRWPAAEEAAAYAREHPQLSVGLHVDLGEWDYVDGNWCQRYEVPGDNVECELLEQLARFRELTGRDPTHLDSHQHVHRDEPLRTIARTMAEEIGAPLREFSSIAYRGDFYGQSTHGEPEPDAITAEALVSIICSLPEGMTELGCHPADPPDLDSQYRLERGAEVNALCDPRVRERLEAVGVELISFADV
jgi:predicted glycoside hydrolase/deacetylase ChbG (UPF0249 family)